MSRVVTGLEILARDPAPIRGRRWALLANQAAVTAELESARAVLSATAGPPALLFAPEHGLDGVAQDMEAVADERDSVTGAPVRSLYGHTAATLEPHINDLEGLEALVVDVPDIGSRYYTFAATMDAVMAACTTAAIEVIVLDRPNPIGGARREGGPVEPGCESFVSRLPTPIRHGLTLGEIALLLRRERYPDLAVGVVTCRNWSRTELWDRTSLPWVPPSPNMPTLETALIYPGLCLIEATTLSEGRGTTRPFHLVGAPWADGEAVVNALRSLTLPGAAFRTARFRPQFGKHAGAVCGGIEVHVTDRDRLRPVSLGLHIVKAFHDLFPDHFAWRTEPYEFISDVPAIDLLTGSPDARHSLEDGTPIDDLLSRWRTWTRRFEETLEGVNLYHD